MVTITTHGYNGSSDNDSNKETAGTKLRYTCVNDKIPVSFSAGFRTGRNAYLSVSARNSRGEIIYGYAEGDPVQAAEKSAIERDNILKALKKLGNTVFTTDDDLIEAEIDSNAFGKCASLEEITLPDSIKTIRLGAFRLCVHLKNVVIPEGVEKIETRAFFNCASLESVSIPNSVALIEEETFKGCPKLSINCHKGSYAEVYAKNNGISVEYM